MRKAGGVVLALVLAVLMAGIVLPVRTKADALTDVCDEVFKQTMTGILEKEGYGDAEIAAEKLRLYDINLESLGYLYDFSINGERGYGIVVDDKGEFSLTELYLRGKNPYAGREGTPVYICFTTYWVHDGEGFIDAQSGERLSGEFVEMFVSKAFIGGGSSSYSTETVNFTYIDQNKVLLSNYFPNLIPVGSVTCVPTATANILAYYDRWYPEIFPNVEPGRDRGFGYDYLINEDDLKDELNTLQSLMQYESNAGATIETFKTGLRAFMKGTGYSAALFSLQNFDEFVPNSLCFYIDRGYPSIIFCDGFNVNTVDIYDNQTIIHTYRHYTAHAMAVFGYHDINYTLPNKSNRVDSFFIVAPGVVAFDYCYVNIDKNITIDAGYAMRIEQALEY